MRIPSGTTNRYIYFVAVDITDLKTRETALGSFTVYYEINNGVATAMTTPTVTEADATNMPGVYSLLIDESGMTTLTAGHDTAELCLHITQASMAPVTRVVEIFRVKLTEGELVAAASNAITTVTTTTTATNVTTVNGLAANVITATSINADAITAAKIATGAIDADSIAADAITATKIATGAITAAKFAAGAIDAAAIANGAIDAATFAAGAIDAAAIAAGAIDADALAADAATEIANAVWDTDATGRQTQGTFGQAIGDPAADTNTIYKAVVTDATGATVGVDVVAVKAQTAAIEVDTAEIGAAGAGLTAADDAVMTRLGAPAGASVSVDIAAIKADTAAILTDTGTTLDAALAVVDANVDAILADTGTDGVVVAAASKTGYTLTATTGLGNQTANITGNLSGSVGSVTGAVGSVTGAVGSVTGMTASDVGAIKAKTDSLTFTVANQVDSNVQSVNDVTIVGNGAGTPFQV